MFGRIILAVATVLIGVNILCLIRINGMKDKQTVLQDTITNTKASVQLYRIQITGVQNNTIEAIKLENNEISPTAKIYDEQHQQYQIGREGKKTLYFRLFEQNCVRCLTEYIKTLDDFCSKNHLDYKLISNFSSKNSLKIFKTSGNIKSPVMTCDTLLKNENVDLPYFFTLSPDGRVDKIFMPQEGMDRYETMYLNSIKGIFLNTSSNK